MTMFVLQIPIYVFIRIHHHFLHTYIHECPIYTRTYTKMYKYIYYVCIFMHMYVTYVVLRDEAPKIPKKLNIQEMVATNNWHDA